MPGSSWYSALHPEAAAMGPCRVLAAAWLLGPLLPVVLAAAQADSKVDADGAPTDTAVRGSDEGASPTWAFAGGGSSVSTEEVNAMKAMADEMTKRMCAAPGSSANPWCKEQDPAVDGKAPGAPADTREGVTV
mmetsp:Transcript_82081/g.232681  ORF Transcript_82081/g.232681 Transcript_82081/m.232681 type:complete len:133 (+) Transcript_82081:5-403(+)